MNNPYLGNFSEGAPQQHFEDKHVSTFGGSLKDSWYFYKANFRRLFSFFFWLTFIPFLLTIGAYWLSGVMPSKTLELGILSMVVTLFFDVVYFGSVIRFQELDAGIFRNSWRSFVSIVRSFKELAWTLLLTVLSLTLFALVLNFLLKPVLYNLTPNIVGSVHLFLGAVAASIFGVFVGSSVMIERQSGITAIIKSFWAFKNRKLQTLKFILLAIIILLTAIIIGFLILGSIVVLVLHLKFGSFNAGMLAYNEFMLVNVGAMDVAPTYKFYIMIIICALVASIFISIGAAWFKSFLFKIWQNAKLSAPAIVAEDYNNKTGKIIKIFSWIGLVLWIVIIANFIYRLQHSF